MSNTNLAQSIKQQILVRLQALKTAGQINSIAELDNNANPFKIEPSNGYPLAITAMPRTTSDFEDQATNIRTYRFDILIIIDPETLQNPTEGMEIIMDAILDQFDTNFTLAGAAQAAMLPAEVESAPVSTGDKTYLCFFVTLKCRTLYSI